MSIVSLSMKSFHGKARTDEQVGQAMGGDFYSVTAPIDAIVKHVFVDGLLMFPADYDQSAFKRDLETGVKEVQPYTDKRGKNHRPTARQGRYFLGIQLLVADIDDGLPAGTPEQTLSYILNTYPALNGAVAAIFPSSSYTTEKPKMHLLFVLSEVLTDRNEYADLAARYSLALNLPSDRAMYKVEQPLYGTVFDKGDYAGVPVSEDMLYFDSSAVLSVGYLRSLPALEVIEAVQRPEKAQERREVKARSEGIHRKAGKAADREALALAKYILDAEVQARKLKGRSDFLGFAQALKNVVGADIAFDLIDNHAIWDTTYIGSTTRDGLERLLEWEQDEDRQNTVGTLYHLATERGYGVSSPMDVTPANASQVINVQYVGEALTDNLPTRALLKSYTGSGKTTLLTTLLQRVHKQVLVIAPLKNLVEDMVATLHKAGYDAQSYLDDDEIKMTADMRKAKILVVTPQSAARLLDSTHNIGRYGLVWIEEIDQIIRAAIYPADNKKALYNHTQSNGFLNLVAAALRSDIPVWGVDAGLTQVTVDWFKSITTDFEVIVNTFQPAKAPVTIYPTAESALLQGIRAAVRGEKVHFVTDTVKGVSGTRAIVRMLERHKLTEKSGKVKVIDSEQTNNNEWLKAANENLQSVQVLVSSPTLKSGVNITEWIPDLVVLVYTHLTPRDALQAANRTRKHGQVVAYFGMPHRLDPILTRDEISGLYAASFNDLVNIGQAFKVARNENATLRTHLSTLVEIDVQAQLQMPSRFARSLFEQEGRAIVYPESVGGLSEADNRTRKEDTRESEIRSTWNTVAPINRDNPAPVGMGLIDRLRGMAHSAINGMTRGGHKHELEAGQVTPEEVYDITHSGVKANLIERAIAVVPAGTRMVEQLHNPDFGLRSIELDVAEEQVWACLADFVVDGHLTAETQLEHSERFIRLVQGVEGAYNRIVRSRESFAEVYNPDDVVGSARKLATIILRTGGLQLGRGERRRLENPYTGKRLNDWHIVNLDYVKKLLTWRWLGRNENLTDREKQDIPLVRLVFKKVADQIEAKGWYMVLDEFRGMDADTQDKVLALVEAGVTPENAVMDATMLLQSAF